MYWINYNIVINSKQTNKKKKNQVEANLNFNQMNSWCINYNQYIQNWIKKKLYTKAINYASFKLEEKATRSVKKNKKTWEALNVYFSNKLQFQRKLYYYRPGLITSETKMRAAGMRCFIFWLKQEKSLALQLCE